MGRLGRLDLDVQVKLRSGGGVRVVVALLQGEECGWDLGWGFGWGLRLARFLAMVLVGIWAGVLPGVCTQDLGGGLAGFGWVQLGSVGFSWV